MMKGYYKIRKKALDILNTKLSKDLHYHGINHTLNVLKVINQYIKRENVNSTNAKLLRIGVLLHDIGFTISNNNHELRSLEIANKLMLDFGFTCEQFEIVKDLILSTRIPQKPKNKLEKIICDADLDYLGRPDYYPISDLLFKELKAYSIITTKKDWNKTQLRFLENHKFHTKFAQKNRQPNKQKRIEELKQLVSKNPS